MKLCNKGLHDLDDSAVAYIRPGDGGRRCGPCRNAAMCKWRSGENSEQHRAYQRAWYAKHPERYRAAGRKRELQKYGITSADYDRMLQEQNGVCAICGQPETRTLRGKVSSLAVDHDHRTGNVRGLLCFKCNTKLDALLNNPAWWERAVQYAETDQPDMDTKVRLVV